MTKQETFDTVVAHLREQRVKAVHPVTELCRYRTSNGLKCAVGCLIPDDKYTPAIEGESLLDPWPTEHIDRLLEELHLDVELCRDLQRTHDEYEPHYWEGEFIAVAETHGLRYTPPNA